MKLTERNYFSPKASMEYMGVSQWKAFNKCPAAALAEAKGRYKKDKTSALLVGSYVDSYFEGSLLKFKGENPEIFKKDGSLRSEYAQAELIIQRIQKDRLFMQFLSGKKQVIMTGEINGVKVKIKIDSYHQDKIVDLKIMRDFENVYVPENGRVPWFEAWGYDIQGAVYQEIVRQNTGLILPFYLAAATKEKVTDIDIVELKQELLDFALDKFKQDLEFYDAVKKGVIEPVRCEKCDYCKSTKVLKEPTSSEEFYFDL